MAGRETEDYKVASSYLKEIYNIIFSLFVDARGQLGNMNNREDQFAHSFLAIFSWFFCLEIKI